MPAETLVHHEQPISPDVQKPRYDALLIHGYWMSEPKPGNVRLALRSRLAVRAAVLAYDGGRGARKIVIDLGHLWGTDYPSEGNLMAKKLADKYSIPHDAIILGENAYSTGGEVKSFLELAKQNGWTSLLDVAFARHHWTIPGVYKQYGHEGISVAYGNIEDIIREKGNRTYKLRRVLNPKAPEGERIYVEKGKVHNHVNGLIRGLAQSRYGLAYTLYEGAKLVRMHMPGFNYDAQEQKNKAARIDKGKEFIVPIDVYSLNGKRV